MNPPVNPALPAGFDGTPNEQRPESHLLWWGRPYVVTYSWAQMATLGSSAADRDKWYSAWPSGTRYDVRCLDGGSWDRSTWWGSFSTLAAALDEAAARDTRPAEARKPAARQGAAAGLRDVFDPRGER